MAGRTDRGAALVVSLILLGLLVTAAIGAVRSVSLELVMAGNEHYRHRAAAAASAGAALMAGAVWSAPAGGSPASLPSQPVDGSSGDFLSAEVVNLGIDPDIATTSDGAFSGQRYRIVAHGSSLRGARCDLELGVVMIRDAAGIAVELRHRYWKRLPG